MGNGKHTPGPWKYSHSSGSVLPRIYDAEGGLIMIFKSLKNANDLPVVAAAPELLGALEAIDSLLDDEVIDLAIISEIIYQATTKAKGETQ